MREKSELLSTKAEQLEWRRSKVTELRAIGLSYAEIAHELHVSRTSIASDIAYIRSQAKETIKEYTTEHLPEQYQVCLSALDTIPKHAYEILETSDDNRVWQTIPVKHPGSSDTKILSAGSYTISDQKYSPPMSGNITVQGNIHSKGNLVVGGFFTPTPSVEKYKADFASAGI